MDQTARRLMKTDGQRQSSFLSTLVCLLVSVCVCVCVCKSMLICRSMKCLCMYMYVEV